MYQKKKKVNQIEGNLTIIHWRPNKIISQTIKKDLD